MILSHDKSKVFFSVPRTGSTTARMLLIDHRYPLFSPEEIYTTKAHLNRSELKSYFEEKGGRLPDFLDVTGYAFWRDPVDRYVSSATHYRLNTFGLKRLFPEIFGPGMSHDLSPYPYVENRMTKEYFQSLPVRIQEKIINPTDEVSFFKAVRRIKNELKSIMFLAQTHWLAQPNMVVLNHHDYINEMRRLLSVFDVPDVENCHIPLANASSRYCIPPTSITDEVRELVKEEYKEDYAFDPR